MNVMKTIEERADAYVGHPFEIDEFSSATIKRQAFIDVATEQRKIDIDKACEFFEKYLFEIGYPDDWCRDSVNVTNGETRFRKFMEE